MTKQDDKINGYVNAWFLLGQTLMLLEKYQKKVFDEIGISSPQFYTIAAIKYLPPPVTATEIAKWVNRSTNAVNVTLTGMEKEGLVKRTRNLKDRRNLRLTLTKKSEEYFNKTITPYINLPVEEMSSLSDNEVQTLIMLLQKLMKAVAEDLKKNNQKLDYDLHRIEVMRNLLQQQNFDYKPISLES